MSSEAKGGLEDVVVSTSDICFIDGREGRLVYRGYDVNDLVEHSSFEEVVYLLWHGSLPTRKELDVHVKALSATATRKLPPGLIALLRALPKKTTPMEVLRTGVSALSAFDPDATDNSREATARKAVRLTAQMPTLVAAWERIRRGKPLVAPNPKLSLAANCLAMLRGGRPTPLEVKTFDVALILHADHEFNASTFSARVTAATMSDLHSAITSAIGALKGPLHGGANEQVMRMVEEIKSPARAEAWIRKALADKARVMGFGHRVYRVEDPRAKHLRRLATELGRQAGNTSYVEILNTVARVVTEDKHIYPNVDLYSGAAYKSMGIPTDQFTPIFAISRVAGWAAHVMEQHANNRLIRPRAEYTGPTHATYVPIDRRQGGRARRAAREPRDVRLQRARGHARVSREPPRHDRAVPPGGHRQRLHRRDAGALRALPVPVPVDVRAESRQRRRDCRAQSCLAARRHRGPLLPPQRHGALRTRVARPAPRSARRARRRARRRVRRQAAARGRPRGGPDDRLEPPARADGPRAVGGRGLRRLGLHVPAPGPHGDPGGLRREIGRAHV